MFYFNPIYVEQKVFMLSFFPSHVHQTGFEEDWNIQRFSNEENSKIKGFQTNFPKQGGCFAKWREAGNNTGDEHLRKTFLMETSLQRIPYNKFLLAKCHFLNKKIMIMKDFCSVRATSFYNNSKKLNQKILFLYQKGPLIFQAP